MPESKSEIIIMVDEKDRELGPIEKMEAHYKGVLHRAFSILVFNEDKALLLQRRSLTKYHTPGLWTNTCCSHPRYGETLEHAIHRRLQEEMGFQCELAELFDFIYKIEFDTDLFEHELDHVFVGRFNGEVKINPDEVAEYKWMGLDDIKQDIALHPENYTYWFKHLFALSEDKLKAFIS